MAMKSVCSSKRHWVTKFQAGICRTGRMMKWWNQRVIGNCPRCGAPDETTTHVLRCRCGSTEEIWGPSKISLEKWMNEYKTCPDLKRMLLQFIEQWRLGREVSNITDIEFESAQGIFVEQKKIGWRNMIGGCFSNVWVLAQGDYYKWLRVRRTRERWVAELIKKLWNISWDLWQERNDILHKTSRNAVLRGTVSLDNAIIEEC